MAKVMHITGSEFRSDRGSGGGAEVGRGPDTNDQERSSGRPKLLHNFHCLKNY